MIKKLKKLVMTVPLVIGVLTFISAPGNAAGTMSDIVTTLFGEDAQTIDIVVLLTILSLLPSILIMMTGFTRIVIVLGFVRNALGTQQAPPTQVIIGLALFLTLFVMKPVLTQVYDDAYVPYTEGVITQDEFLDRAMTPTKEFMLRQTDQKDMEFFLAMAREPITEEQLADNTRLPASVVIPAFLVSEIKRAFLIGFFVYIPFIVVDMVVASTLMAMGMMMLPPAMISLPFKILIFVMVDGWQLVIGSLIQGFK